jgi:hypothetical protein
VKSCGGMSREENEQDFGALNRIGREMRVDGGKRRASFLARTVKTLAGNHVAVSFGAGAACRDADAGSTGHVADAASVGSVGEKRNFGFLSGVQSENRLKAERQRSAWEGQLTKK